jgi:uncharacterized protein (DUF1501 family)
MTEPLSRRAALRQTLGLSLGLGLGMNVSFLGSGAMAADSRSPKLVVIICRGAMDGLSVSPPAHDTAYLDLRGAIAIPPDRALPLDSDFGLHPKLVNVQRLALAGQARIAPAVAWPVHIRSHFEAQDLLETGADKLYGVQTGWLNRTVQALGGDKPARAIAVAPQAPLILQGTAAYDTWSPGTPFNPAGSRLVGILQDLYQPDPILGPAFAAGLAVEHEAMALNANAPALKANDARDFATAAARFLAAPGGPAIAVISLDGFDTHAGQGAAEGQLANRLSGLDDVMAGLETGLAADWARTAVVVATEFGRTARINGSGGTDHGTASTLILAGGSIKGRGIVGDWPGLAAGQLFENRDTAPTLDMRRVFKTLIVEHLGVDRHLADTQVFPESRDAGLISGLI